MSNTETVTKPPRLAPAQAKILREAQEAHQEAARAAKKAKDKRDALMERYAEFLPLNEEIVCGPWVFKRTESAAGESFDFKGFKAAYVLNERMKKFVKQREPARSLKISER